MSAELRYTPDALRDLTAVWRSVYEVSKSMETADEYVAGILRALEAKKPFPLSGSPLDFNGLATGIYSVPYKRYRAFYRVRDGAMEVGRILPTRRDYVAVLFGGDVPDTDDIQ